MKEEIKDQLIKAQAELIRELEKPITEHTYHWAINNNSIRKSIATLTEKIDNFDHLTNEASKTEKAEPTEIAKKILYKYFHHFRIPGEEEAVLKAMKENASVNNRQLLLEFFQYFRDNGESNIGMSIERFVDTYLDNRFKAEYPLTPEEAFKPNDTNVAQITGISVKDENGKEMIEEISDADIEAWANREYPKSMVYADYNSPKRAYSIIGAKAMRDGLIPKNTEVNTEK